MAKKLDSLEGCRALVAEDEPFIALMLGEIVEGAGGTVVAIAQACSEALRIIEQQSVQLVVLDVHLKGEVSDVVLHAADAKGIPVLVSSGSDPGALPESFSGRLLLAKPWTIEEAERALLSAFHSL